MIRFHLHGYGEFDDARRIGPCAWPHFDLLFIHAGHVSIRLGGEQRGGEDIELRDGESVLIFPHTPFRGQSIAPSSRASVQHFAIEGRDRGAELRPPFDDLAKLRRGFRAYGARAGRRVEGDIARAMRLSSVAPSPLLQQMREATLTLILAELGDATESREVDAGDAAGAAANLDAVIAWAEQHLDRGPTVNDLAGRAGLSPSHFRAVFARRVGRSAGAFLLDLRVREASRLLRETRTSIKQIARAVGYGDVAALHHALRRRTGLTPAAYRARHAPAG